MKIRPDHYETLKAAIVDRVGGNYDAIRKPYIKAGLSDERFRWDLLYATPITIGDSVGRPSDLPLYDYMDDSHIDTALRAIIREIESLNKD